MRIITLPLRSAKQQFDEKRAAEKAAKKKARDEFNLLSPASKVFHKKHIAFIADKAYQELLALRAKTNGPKHNDIQTVVDKYHARKHTFIQRWHIEYRIEQAKAGKPSKNIFFLLLYK
jgi:hypothetical protein